MSERELQDLYFQENKTGKHIKHDFQTNEDYSQVTLKQIY